MKFKDTKPGDIVLRMLAGTLPMRLQVTEVTDELIVAGEWTFDRATGAEIDEELGWGPPPLQTGSVLVPDDAAPPEEKLLAAVFGGKPSEPEAPRYGIPPEALVQLIRRLQATPSNQIGSIVVMFMGSPIEHTFEDPDDMQKYKHLHIESHGPSPLRYAMLTALLERANMRRAVEGEQGLDPSLH